MSTPITLVKVYGDFAEGPRFVFPFLDASEATTFARSIRTDEGLAGISRVEVVNGFADDPEDFYDGLCGELSANATYSV